LGYRALTEKLCGVMLEDAPHITRSNWLQRPLTPEQYEYAVNDVVYLSQAWPLLRDKLNERGWLAACIDETAARVKQMLEQPDPDSAWRRLGGLERLSEPSVRVARRLYQWREQVAVADDVARNRLMRDGVLLEISRLQPTTFHQLLAIADLRPGVVRRYGDQILQCMELSETDNDDLALMPSIDPKMLRQLLAPLKKVVSHWASAHDLPEPLLASRTMLTALLLAWLHGTRLPDWIEGWRATELSPMLMKVMEENRGLVDTV
jgi:ribonuclease D